MSKSKLSTPEIMLAQKMTIVKAAQTKSLYSAPDDQTLRSFSIPSPSSYYETLAVILLSGLLDYWENDQIFRNLANLCYYHQYQGSWAKVQAILEQSTTYDDPELVIKSTMSSDDYYGNLVPLALRYSNVLKPRFQTEPGQKRKVKELVRRRGYKDKGSAKPEHVKGRNLPGEDNKIDRRHLIAHPLLTKRYSSNEVFSTGHLLRSLEEIENLVLKRKEERESVLTKIQRAASGSDQSAEGRDLKNRINLATLSKSLRKEEQDRIRAQTSEASNSKTEKEPPEQDQRILRKLQYDEFVRRRPVRILRAESVA